ncbi:MAG: energy-coupling factor transporter transmembrane protein EcfT [Chloroflexi bacterium]|nr:energy-coupling factor transporter transmembrane protein EcfT [Chloroflexota bacterium]
MRLAGYIERQSFIHRLDPRLKLLGTLVISILALLFSTPLSLGLLFLVLPVVWWSAKIGDKILDWLRGLAPLFIMTFLLWLLLGSGGHAKMGGEAEPLISLWGVITISSFKMKYAVAMVIRVLILITVCLTLLMTTDFSDIFIAIRKIGLPYRAAFLLSLTFQLAPILAAEFLMVRDAQKARGQELDKGNLIERIKKNVGVTVPSFVRAIRLGYDMNMALETFRFSRAGCRTLYRDIQFALRDYIVLILIMALLLSGLWLRLRGFGVA